MLSIPARRQDAREQPAHPWPVPGGAHLRGAEIPCGDLATQNAPAPWEPLRAWEMHLLIETWVRGEAPNQIQGLLCFLHIFSFFPTWQTRWVLF